MTRARLWTSTLLACAAVVLAATPAVREAAAPAVAAVAPALAPAVARVRSGLALLGFDLSMWLIGAGVTAIVVGLTLRSLRRRDDMGLRIRVRVHRGVPIARIARDLGLPQDVVRDLAGPVLARPLEQRRELPTRGSLFRRAPAAPAATGDRFLDVLRATLSRATR